MTDAERAETVIYDADEVFGDAQGRLSDASGERRQLRRRRGASSTPAPSVSSGLPARVAGACVASWGWISVDANVAIVPRA